MLATVSALLEYVSIIGYLLLSRKFPEDSEREEVTKVKRWPFPGQGHTLTIWYKKVPVLRVIQTGVKHRPHSASWLCTVCVLRKSLSLALHQRSHLQSMQEANESPVVVCPHSSLRELSLSNPQTTLQDMSFSSGSHFGQHW